MLMNRRPNAWIILSGLLTCLNTPAIPAQDPKAKAASPQADQTKPASPKAEGAPKPVDKIDPTARLREPVHDRRLASVRTLDDYHPWNPITRTEDLTEWRTRLRTRVKVALGLWPEPPRQPIKATVHTPIDRGEYTVEHVFFESLPGHYVTGNLYRPKNKTGRLPIALCPHGHWEEARFHQATPNELKQSLESGGESFESNGSRFLQAQYASLARMGIMAFHYDMVGYCESKPLAHRKSFDSVDSLLRLHSITALQTWNSIRALDWMLSREDADPDRVLITGASGGGTQTFLLCAVDDRPTVSVPAVMVSTAMQGGCVCENAPLLRSVVATSNWRRCTHPNPCSLLVPTIGPKRLRPKVILS